MRAVLLGPPGAGKGTQAKLLAQRLNIPHIASGDLFRTHQERGTPLGLKAREYMERGVLVPDEITIAMVLEHILSLDRDEGFILDGFPRNLNQAEALDRALRERGRELDRVLYIRVSEGELVRRLSGRLVCRRCQTPYHLESSPPRNPGRCDVCGGELYQREDDTPEAVRRRIQVYQTETAPLVEYYRRAGKLVEVEGEGPLEEVNRRLLESLRG